jgi:HK97 family phage major capsid protein/HK97 family phage prohead protease
MNRLNISTRDATGLDSSKVMTRLAEMRKHPLRRESTVLKESIDMAERTVQLSFSSEIEFKRWYGIEVLDHSPGAVRMGRLTDAAALLWNHNQDDQRGVVQSASIGTDNRGHAVVRFSRSPAGEQLLQDIADGIVTKVSVGYLVHAAKLQEERGDIDVYRVTDWEPFEISMVSVPADTSVGVGRSLENPQEEQRAKPSEDSASVTDSAATRAHKKDIEPMKYRHYRDAQGNLCRVAVNDAGEDSGQVEVIERAGAERAAGADAERARVRAITELGKTYGKPELAMEHIAEGKTPEDFQRALLADFQTQRSNKPLEEQQRDANIGMTQGEVRQFSIMRAIRAMVDPTDTAARKAAAFEFECSRAAAEAYGKNPKGIIIPNDVLSSRGFSIGSGNGGSATGSSLVGTTHLAGSFIDLLRKRAWVMRRARTLAGLVGNVDIPRQNATGAAYWVGEGGAPTQGTPGVDQIVFSPKTVGAYTDITRRLMMQGTPDAEALVRDDLLKIIALEIDRVAIYGSGSSNQPLGLKNVSGINAVDFATAGQPTFAELVQMETEIALDNADVDSMSYAFNAAIRGYAKTKVKFASAGSATIWEPGNTVNGYATDVSNQVATGDVFFANWQDMIIAMWGGLELTVDPYSLSTSGGLRLVALQDIDINLRHKESFCYGSDTVTP